MARSRLPLAAVAALVIANACAPSGAPAASPAPTSDAAGGAAPTFELRLAASDPTQTIPDTGPYGTATAAVENVCRRMDDGFWQLRYSGGDPYVRVLLLIGPDAIDGTVTDAVSSEIVIGSPLTTLLHFDQPGYRSGDAPGRSTATVTTTTGNDAITFAVDATTPRATTEFTDYPYTVDVDLTVTCPLGG